MKLIAKAHRTTTDAENRSQRGDALEKGRKRTTMDFSFNTHLSSRYLVAVVPLSGTVASSARKLSVVSEQDPEHVCGQALRVGYTGSLPTDLALYHLKIKPAPELLAVTLSGLFVLELGIFHAYAGPFAHDERAEQHSYVVAFFPVLSLLLLHIHEKSWMRFDSPMSRKGVFDESH